MKWLIALVAQPKVAEALRLLVVAVLAATLAPLVGEPQVVARLPDVPVLDGQHLGLSAS